MHWWRAQSSIPWRLLARVLVHCNWAMKDVLIGCLLPPPHSGRCSRELPLAHRPSNKHFWKCARKAPESMMIGKALLSGLWVCLEHRRCLVFPFSPWFMFHRSSRLVLHFTTLAVTRRCRCLLRGAFMWIVMPCRLVPCDLGDPGGGIPGFHMVLCCFSHSLVVWVFLFGFVVLPYHIEMI